MNSLFTTKNAVLVFALILIAGAIFFLESGKNPRMPGASQDIAVSATGERAAVIAAKAGKYDKAKELAGVTGYINANDGFKLADVIGKKVILVDFWTYSCINCQRTLPYLKEWYSKYKDKGFVIVGVHTPEFDFEKVLANVQKAVSAAGIEYPVVLDSNRATWDAYGNRYWPHEYLIDIDGYVVEDHIGEGGYDETEKAIQNALAERAQVLGEKTDVNMPITVPHEDDIQAGSPETYFGSARNEYLGNGVSGLSGEQYFKEPQTVDKNKLYLIGKWNMKPEYAETSASVGDSTAGSDRIDYRYAAKSAYFVAGSNTPTDVEVLLDSAPVPQSLKGADVFYKNGRSYVRVGANTLYRIIEGAHIEEHFLEFIISSPGLQAFTFTFG